MWWAAGFRFDLMLWNETVLEGNMLLGFAELALYTLKWKDAEDGILPSGKLSHNYGKIHHF